MSDNKHSPLLWGLEQPIGPVPGFFSALQHVMAGLVGIITPPLIISAALGLGAYLPWLISMSLLASGIGTFLQANRVFGVGAGMICMQGTSFAFLGVTIAGGLWVKGQGGTPEDIMAMLFGVNFIAAWVPAIVSRFVHLLRRVFTPIVTGTVITLIGLSLIKVSIINWSGGHNATDFASMSNIGLGAFTLAIIVLLSCAKNQWLRLAAIVIGMAAGCIVAWLTGHFHPVLTIDTWFRPPALFPFGFQFNLAIFLPIALVSLVCILEAVGDLTANSLISRQPIEGKAFRSRLQGGILADGVSCMIAAMLCAFPNTIFAQNNGVIQMTGVASRFVGRYIGILLIFLGLFPPFGEALRQIPLPVLGGATLVMFGCVVAAGIRIITQTPLGRREMLIVGIAFGIGLGNEAVPEFLAHFPPMVKTLFGSAATSGGLIAVLLSLIMPEEKKVISAIEGQNDHAQSV
ncbi:MAG: Xanthine permease XanP [Candidatus Erwinia impunctatus]|nr:Xanthine permease XanP [Culicoides impunctatus]